MDHHSEKDNEKQVASNVRWSWQFDFSQEVEILRIASFGIVCISRNKEKKPDDWSSLDQREINHHMQHIA